MIHRISLFHSRKQVRFGDMLQMPDLKSEADSDEQQNITPYNFACSSTPHRGARPKNQTFDVSHIPNLTSVPHNAAAIPSEVSAAAAAQASKEFRLDARPKNHEVQRRIFG